MTVDVSRKKNILVMMSTYNGEKYLEEQLNSIIEQCGVNIFLKIRDDGSTDGTIEILKKYKDCKNIDVEYGENIGWKNSFMKLLYESDEYDYYAFADQDDFWKPNKIIKATEKLRNTQKPTLYYSNYTIVDEKLELITGDFGIIPPKRKLTVLTQNFALGCTIVMNKYLADLVKEYTINYMFAHDVWIPILANFAGEIVHDQESSILYRQHGNNATGAIKKGFSSQIKERISSHTKNQNYYYYAQELSNGYSCYMSPTDQELLNTIIRSKYDIKSRIELLLNPGFRKNTIKGTILLKLISLINF